MKEYREVKEYFSSQKIEEGTGTIINRGFGFKDLPKFDPFLLLDFFDSTDYEEYKNGFSWHPHRGIETITYLISGEIEYEDTLGNTGNIRGGDCSWLTTGSGVIHKEIPKKSSHLFGIQIWLNLPREYKLINPVYKNICLNNIPEYREDGKRVKVIAGKYKNKKGIRSRFSTEPMILDVILGKNESFEIKLPEYNNAFTLTIDGEVNYETKKENFIKKGEGVIYQEGCRVKINTNDSGGRFLFFSGRPLYERIVWGGPIVVNTESELEKALKELEEDSFIREKSIF